VSLQHVAVEVREADTAACISFWGLLGFWPVEVPPSLQGDTAWVERDGLQIHLLVADDPVVPPKGHVAVVCPDYEETLARLRESGFEPDPRREHWGAPRCFVRGPGGHRVEVMAAPPG
jgi:catechol 2,3-dioxygenase-like lactoylglutathione lyase family enzyme